MSFIDQTVMLQPCPEHHAALSPRPRTRVEATGFLFINSKRRQVSKRNRSSTRSYVMQHVRHQRRWSTSEAQADLQDADPASGDIEEQDERERQRGASKSRASTSSGLERSLEAPSASSRADYQERAEQAQAAFSEELDTTQLLPLLASEQSLDPFCSLPIRLDRRARWMLDEYFSRMSQCMTLGGRTNLSICRGWFAASFASRAFLYSVLCAAATHMYALSQTTLVTILQYKSQAVTELNAALADPMLRVADGSIGAVFNLLCVAETFPLPRCEGPCSDVTEAQSQRLVHLQGLKRMIALRGGLPSLKANECLYSFLLWHCTTHSIASFKPANYYLGAEPYQRLIQEQYRSENAQTSHLKMLDLMRASELPEILLTTLDHISDLNQQVHACLEAKHDDPKFLHLTNFSSLIVQHLLNYIGTRRVDLEYMPKAMAIALLMLTTRIPNESATSIDPLHFSATGWLRHALIASYCEDWNPELYLWACTIGAICSHGSRDSADIERAFVFAVHLKGVKTAEQLEEIMESLLWMQVRFHDGLSELWARLGDKLVMEPQTPFGLL